MRRRATLKAGIAVLAAALLAAVLTSATPSPARADSDADAVIIELRVWQRVDNLEDVWVSARPEGGRWDTLGTIPLPRSGLIGGYAPISWHRYGEITIAGVALRVWQPVSNPERVYVQACANACPDWRLLERPVWSSVGMRAVPLHRGLTASGRYRHGELEIAVPRGNPGLLADRDYLLELRHVLHGSALDWSGGRATAEWEGVTLGGTPPRVTGLHLATRGLAGEIWGWLGNLTELRELDLSGNALTGMIPSKLSLLTNLQRISLAGNALEGCVPPQLRAVTHHDLDSLGLPDCADPPPAFRSSDFGRTALTMGTYRQNLRDGYVFVFDVPPENSLRWEAWGDEDSEDWGILVSVFDGYEVGFALRNAHDTEMWLFLTAHRGRRSGELERSHYRPCTPDCEGVKWTEQLAASIWVNRAITDYGEWVWP